MKNDTSYIWPAMVLGVISAVLFTYLFETATGTELAPLAIAGLGGLSTIFWAVIFKIGYHQ